MRRLFLVLVFTIAGYGQQRLNNGWQSGPVTPSNCKTGDSPTFYNYASLNLWDCVNNQYVVRGGGTGTPGGAPGQVQFNNSGAFGGLTISGDATLNIGTGVLTLSTVNVGPGSCGDSTHVCQVTVDGKGRVTSQTAVAISGSGGGITSINTDATAAQTLTKTNDTNVSLTITDNGTGGHNFGLGWLGTLAAARLNANVVQAITNDTNIQGSISGQNLTFAWAGTLAKSRIISSAVFNDQSNTFSTGSQDFSAATHFLPKHGLVANLPATCSVGEVYSADNATPGQNWYFCTATNTWTQQLNAGGVTTTGSPANGNLTKFSGPGTVTNADLTGDVSTSGGVATTLATVNVSPGSCGDSTHVCQITTDGKGRTTTQSAVAIVAGTGAAGQYTSVTFSSTPTFTASSNTNNSWLITLTGNVTSSTLGSGASGQVLNFKICQDATGGRTFAWPTGFTTAATISPIAGVCTKESFFWDGSAAALLSVSADGGPAYFGQETAAPATPATSAVYCWQDSTDHTGWECKANNSATIFKLVKSGVDVTTSTGVVAGINGVPLCSGFSPSNSFFLQYTTGGSPNPCWTTAAGGGGGGGPTVLSTQANLGAVTIVAGPNTIFTYSMPGSSLSTSQYLKVEFSANTSGTAANCTEDFNFGATGLAIVSGGSLASPHQWTGTVLPVTGTAEDVMATGSNSFFGSIDTTANAGETLSGTVVISVTVTCTTTGGTVTPRRFVVTRFPS